MPAAPFRTLLTRLAQVAACALVVSVALGAAAPEARAELTVTESAPPPPTGLDAGLEQQVRTLALEGSARAPDGVLRVEVVVGQLDSRLRLAPCAKVEPYLPNGTRLWGKSRIGLRCAQGSTLWNVYLPITVKAYGRALVATGPLSAGSILKSTDLAQAEIDLAEEATPALVEPEQALGRALAQSLKAGQGVHAGHLRSRQWFTAGDTVRVLAVGEGFRLEGEAQALSNGIEGQPARVRTESGRVLTGQPVGDRRLEVVL